MGVRTFQDNDSDYVAWLDEHPEGWVANTFRGFPPSIFKIHRANCPKARDLSRATGPQPFTGGQYVKTVSESLLELTQWAALKSFRGFPDDAMGKCCCADVGLPRV